MSLQEALQIVKDAGYRVSAPRVRNPVRVALLNAIGKPYSPQFDPNYRMKYRTPRLSSAPMPSNTSWVPPTGGTMTINGEVTPW